MNNRKIISAEMNQNVQNSIKKVKNSFNFLFPLRVAMFVDSMRCEMDLLIMNLLASLQQNKSSSYDSMPWH